MTARGLRILVALLAAAPLTAGRLQAQSPGVGAMAPVLSVHDLDGHSVDLGEWIGHRPVFLQWWATWCTSCRALDPTVRAAKAAYGDQVEFIGIDVTVADPRDSVRAWVAREHPPWRVLYDDEGASQRAYDVEATSYVVIIDRNGRIVYTGIGGSQSFGAALRRVTTH
jgi:thiol-disulfide isomerase/thioredoxin